MPRFATSLPLLAAAGALALAGCGSTAPPPSDTAADPPASSAPASTAPAAPSPDVRAALPEDCDGYPAEARTPFVPEDAPAQLTREPGEDSLVLSLVPAGSEVVICAWTSGEEEAPEVFEVGYAAVPDVEAFWREKSDSMHAEDADYGWREIEGVGDRALIRLNNGTGGVTFSTGGVVVQVYAGTVPSDESGQALLTQAALAALGQVRG